MSYMLGYVHKLKFRISTAADTNMSASVARNSVVSLAHPSIAEQSPPQVGGPTASAPPARKNAYGRPLHHEISPRGCGYRLSPGHLHSHVESRPRSAAGASVTEKGRLVCLDTERLARQQADRVAPAPGDADQLGVVIPLPSRGASVIWGRDALTSTRGSMSQPAKSVSTIDTNAPSITSVTMLFRHTTVLAQSDRVYATDVQYLKSLALGCMQDLMACLSAGSCGNQAALTDCASAVEQCKLFSEMARTYIAGCLRRLAHDPSAARLTLAAVTAAASASARSLAATEFADALVLAAEKSRK
jgi:hypothetical protein